MTQMSADEGRGKGMRSTKDHEGRSRGWSTKGREWHERTDGTDAAALSGFEAGFGVTAFFFGEAPGLDLDAVAPAGRGPRLRDGISFSSSGGADHALGLRLAVSFFRADGGVGTAGLRHGISYLPRGRRRRGPLGGAEAALLEGEPVFVFEQMGGVHKGTMAGLLGICRQQILLTPRAELPIDRRTTHEIQAARITGDGPRHHAPRGEADV
jgi:hypothetical protein